MVQDPNSWIAPKIDKEQVVISGEGQRVSKASLALGQTKGCTGASLGLWVGVVSGPRLKRLISPFLIDFLGIPGIRALYQVIGIPNITESNQNIRERLPGLIQHASWVDSASADCPGFLVLGAAPAPASTFVSELQIVLLR